MTDGIYQIVRRRRGNVDRTIKTYKHHAARVDNRFDYARVQRRNPAGVTHKRTVYTVLTRYSLRSSRSDRPRAPRVVYIRAAATRRTWQYHSPPSPVVRDKYRKERRAGPIIIGRKRHRLSRSRLSLRRRHIERNDMSMYAGSKRPGHIRPNVADGPRTDPRDAAGHACVRRLRRFGPRTTTGGKIVSDIIVRKNWILKTFVFTATTTRRPCVICIDYIVPRTTLRPEFGVRPLSPENLGEIFAAHAYSLERATPRLWFKPRAPVCFIIL